MVAEIAAPSRHIAVAPCREAEYAAPALPGGLVEVQIASGEVAATILLTPAMARLIAEDLRRVADVVGALGSD